LTSPLQISFAGALHSLHRPSSVSIGAAGAPGLSHGVRYGMTQMKVLYFGGVAARDSQDGERFRRESDQPSAEPPWKRAQNTLQGMAGPPPKAAYHHKAKARRCDATGSLSRSLWIRTTSTPGTLSAARKTLGSISKQSTTRSPCRRGSVPS
jgi:hypothetical protein